MANANKNILYQNIYTLKKTFLLYIKYKKAHFKPTNDIANATAPKGLPHNWPSQWKKASFEYSQLTKRSDR